jgi:hypothetical protein
MSLTKLLLGRNNSVMTSLFPPRESLVVTSRLGTGNSPTFFFTVYMKHENKKRLCFLCRRYCLPPPISTPRLPPLFIMYNGYLPSPSLLDFLLSVRRQVEALFTLDCREIAGRGGSNVNDGKLEWLSIITPILCSQQSRI